MIRQLLVETISIMVVLLHVLVYAKYLGRLAPALILHFSHLVEIRLWLGLRCVLLEILN